MSLERMEKNKYQKFIAQILGTRLISYNPDLAKALGSAKAGLFLNQLLYWWEKGKNLDEIYKTIKEIEEETGLSRAEQDTAIKICKKFNALEMKVRGIPAKRYFKLDLQKIANLVESSLSVSDKLVCKKPTKLFVRSPQTNTESTSEITSKEDLLTEDANQGFARLAGIFSDKKLQDYENGKRWGGKPYFRGMEMRCVNDGGRIIWKCIPKEGGDWLEFVGKKSEIEWK